MYVCAGQSLCVNCGARRLSWQSRGFDGFLRVRLAFGGGGGGICFDEFSGLGCDSGVWTSVFPLVLFRSQRRESFKLTEKYRSYYTSSYSAKGFD